MKNKFLPVDLGRLEEKALYITDCFRKYNEVDRSEEYREYHLKKAEDVANSLLRDFGYCFDTFEISGVIPYGLEKSK